MKILIIDDEKTIRDAVTVLAESNGHRAEAANGRVSALDCLYRMTFDLVLLDLCLGADSGLDMLVELREKYPSLAVVVFTAGSCVKTAVEAMRRGALYFLEKPFTAVQLSEVLSLAEKQRPAVKILERPSRETTPVPGVRFESQCPEVQAVMKVLFLAAGSSASVLILGESGTGKSVVARSIHQRSPRSAAPFVTVNCPSLSKDLLESELFGHVAGSFTGAIKDHWGKVRTAEGGTLFLDEIGELPREIQPKLLRLLQDREYERLGETSPRKADIRIIAATNRDLAAEVSAGRFREDLFYRLNVITAQMPPLRERREDLFTLAEQYLSFFVSQCGRKALRFDEPTKELFLSYHWPGNLRELRNAIERAVTLSRDHLKLEDFEFIRIKKNETTAGQLCLGDFASLAAIEQAHIQELLRSTKGVMKVAEILGIDQTTLYRKRKALGLAAPPHGNLRYRR